MNEARHTGCFGGRLAAPGHAKDCQDFMATTVLAI